MATPPPSRYGATPLPREMHDWFDSLWADESEDLKPAGNASERKAVRFKPQSAAAARRRRAEQARAQRNRDKELARGIRTVRQELESPSIESRFKRLGLSEELRFLRKYKADEKGLDQLIAYIRPIFWGVQLEGAYRQGQNAIAGLAKSAHRNGRGTTGLAERADGIVHNLLQAIEGAFRFCYEDHKVGFEDARLEAAIAPMGILYQLLTTVQSDPFLRIMATRKAGRPRSAYRRQTIRRKLTTLLNAICPIAPYFEDAAQRRKALDRLTGQILNVILPVKDSPHRTPQ